MPANYDNIAKVYDFLSRVVYGSSIIKAQVCLLPFVPGGSKILIVGGGTGWILTELTKIHAKGLQIDYVEASGKMTELSMKRHFGENKVNFINMPVEDWQPQYQYEVIITPFLFDNFGKPKIDFIFSKLCKTLNAEGLWLYADFIYEEKKSSYWQRIFLSAMYFFFRITCGIEAQKLISMDNYFKAAYKTEFSASHYNGFIKSIVYRKN